MHPARPQLVYAVILALAHKGLYLLPVLAQGGGGYMLSLRLRH